MTPVDDGIHITVAGEGSRVVATQGAAVTRLDVHSERGMESSLVRFSPTSRPEAVTLRLHLGGLESLHFSFDRHTIAVSVTSSNDHMVVQALSTDGNAPAAPIERDSSFWMAVTRIPHDDGSQALRFDVAAPAAFLSAPESVRAFSFDWLDFYR